MYNRNLLSVPLYKIKLSKKLNKPTFALDEHKLNIIAL